MLRKLILIPKDYGLQRQKLNEEFHKWGAEWYPFLFFSGGLARWRVCTHCTLPTLQQLPPPQTGLPAHCTKYALSNEPPLWRVKFSDPSSTQSFWSPCSSLAYRPSLCPSGLLCWTLLSFEDSNWILPTLSPIIPWVPSSDLNLEGSRFCRAWSLYNSWGSFLKKINNL